MFFKFEYFKDNESIGATYKELKSYTDALECAMLRLNDCCDKIRVYFGDNYDGYFEIK